MFAGYEGPFRVVDAATGVIVWSGLTNAAAQDESSGAAVSSGDFSAWRKPGVYRIETEDGRSSPAFPIADAAYAEAQRGLLKAFYYFRCGMKLEAPYAGPWTHDCCHREPAIVYGDESRRLDAWGGWHDAGDYGKYVSPGAKAVADLLLAWELYPAAFAKPLQLPETDGVMPDVLHECKYELGWMLRMQDPASGGACHKLTTLNFAPFDMMPEDDAAPLYAAPISPTATAGLAAVMAMAARLYEEYDAAFAARCLGAAEQAWGWLSAHPDAPGFRNPPEISTGEYGDKQDADERYWAAAELYRTTGGERYHQAFLALAAGSSFDRFELGWADMGGYGTAAYLLAERQRDDALEEALRAGLRRRAEQLAQIARGDGYGVALRPERYIWGSNMLVMNHAMLMLLADRIAGTAEFTAEALAQVHYLFGRNPTGYSYVTGFGTRPVRHPHHRPSVSDGVEAPIPGLVSGGPNRRLQDDYAREHLTGLPPALCFADEAESYSTHEVAIYWNSPAVFVLSAFAAS